MAGGGGGGGGQEGAPGAPQDPPLTMTGVTSLGEY